MCFSVTSGSACFRRGSQPDHIKQSGCVRGRGHAGTTRLFCFCSGLLPTPRASAWRPGAAGTSLIWFMWFNEDPQTTRGGHLAPYERGGCPTRKPPSRNHFQKPVTVAHCFSFTLGCTNAFFCASQPLIKVERVALDGSFISPDSTDGIKMKGTHVTHLMAPSSASPLPHDCPPRTLKSV